MATSGDDDTVAGTIPGVGTGVALPPLVAHRYQIVRMVGGGGMGRVYEARDTELDERIALKVLRDGLSEIAIERFRREVRLTRRIQHRNVARMFDIGEDVRDGASRRFLTMELVDGEPLTREIGRPMPWPRLRQLALDICAGLAAAHDKGVIHRDLKPDNVLIERGTDRAVITDFGIARADDTADGMTQAGAIIGTPRYMSPEQLAGGELDARADLFSVGVLLYELAAGRRPWSGDSAVAIAVAQATAPARPCPTTSVPAAFAVLVDSCLALERDSRPRSAVQLHGAIAAIPADAEIAARPVPVSGSSRVAPTMTGASPTPDPDTALAVLPIASAPDDQYLADGVREDLIDLLSTSAGLRVRPAGAVAGDCDPRVAGQQLGVDTVVTGSLRRTSSGLRLSARLVSVADGFQIWAQRIDCEPSQLLAVSDQLGTAIAHALSTRATHQPARPVDPRAVELYLRARTELRRFWGEHAETATQLLEQALAISPGSPQIASSYAVAAVMAWFKQVRPELLPRARTAVERALATGHGEAFLASALMRTSLGDIEGGAHDLATALVRAPMAALVHESVGRMLAETSASPIGRQHLETAIALDATRTTLVQADLARLDALLGNRADAERRIASLEADPDPAIQHVGAMYGIRIAIWFRDHHRVVDALRSLRARLTRMNDSVALLDDHIEGRPFDDAKWRRVIAAVSDPDGPRRLALVGMQRAVETAELLGRSDLAMEALQLASHAGVIDLVWLDHCPLLRGLASMPGWAEARERIAARACRVEQVLAVACRGAIP